MSVSDFAFGVCIGLLGGIALSILTWRLIAAWLDRAMGYDFDPKNPDPPPLRVPLKRIK